MTSTAQQSVPRILISWLVALTMIIGPLAMSHRNAYADTARDQARKHYQAGRDLYAAGDFRASIREFETANKLAPSPVLDFNIALSYERLDELDKALAHYKAYINAVPNADNRIAVDAKIQALESELSARSAASEPGAGLSPGTGAGAVIGAGGTGGTAGGTTTGETTTTDALGQNPDAMGTGVISGAGTSTGGVAEAAGMVNPPSAPVYQLTGDPELDRVAVINLAEIRDQRAGQMTSTSASASGQAQSAAPMDSNAGGGKKKSKPAYKQWWFWVVVGVSAVILIDMASGDSGNTATPVRAVPDGPFTIRF